jgi:hypothetical protein
MAFRKIYPALRDSQTGWKCMKSNFLEGKETLPDLDLVSNIQAHIGAHPTGRTAEAWKLSKTYYENCTPDNIDLLRDIYRWSFDQSLFSRSKLFGSGCCCYTLFGFSAKAVKSNLNKNIKDLTQNIQDIIKTRAEEKNPHTRTGIILDRLRR